MDYKFSVWIWAGYVTDLVLTKNQSQQVTNSDRLMWGAFAYMYVKSYAGYASPSNACNQRFKDVGHGLAVTISSQHGYSHDLPLLVSSIVGLHGSSVPGSYRYGAIGRAMGQCYNKFR